MMNELPDKMTGKDLRVQEAHEETLDKNLFDSMDMVDRRDKRKHIVSRVSTIYSCNYNKINWH